MVAGITASLLRKLDVREIHGARVLDMYSTLVKVSEALGYLAEHCGMTTSRMRRYRVPPPELMREAVALEQAFIADCLPVEAVGLSQEDFSQYIDHIADRRLEGVGLAPLRGAVENPLPWLAELMDVPKEQNFFEGRVTEYSKTSALAAVADEEL